jgi:hypothetical protein
MVHSGEAAATGCRVAEFEPAQPASPQAGAGSTGGSGLRPPTPATRPNHLIQPHAPGEGSFLELNPVVLTTSLLFVSLRDSAECPGRVRPIDTTGLGELSVFFR